ncbi:MAG: hypothetical protein ACHQTE_00420 [Candidatus Saccharimonadales bacterium]
MVANTVKTKQQFIELRANDESLAKIAKKLKVSKTTLIAWAKEHELDIQNLRAINYEALHEQYKVSQQTPPRNVVRTARSRAYRAKNRSLKRAIQV